MDLVCTLCAFDWSIRLLLEVDFFVSMDPNANLLSLYDNFHCFNCEISKVL
jgi:hypothetical protein